MKISFSIGLLLLYVISVDSTALIVKRGVTQANLPRINAVRQLVGNATGVVMPKLVWDEVLVKQVDTMSRNCEGWMNTLQTRYAPADPDRNGDKIMKLFYQMMMAGGGAEEFPEQYPHIDKEDLKKMAAALENGVNTAGFSLFNMEFFNPLQTKIGCARKYCEAVIPDEVLQALAVPLQLEGIMHAFYSVCLLGPSGFWDMDQFKKTGAAALLIPAMSL